MTPFQTAPLVWSTFNVSLYILPWYWAVTYSAIYIGNNSSKIYKWVEKKCL